MASPYGKLAGDPAAYQPVGYEDLDQKYLELLSGLDDEDFALADAASQQGQQVVWTPHPGFQEKAVSWACDELLIGGAAGPGKTDCLIYGSLQEIHHPATRVLFLRRTFGELREVMDRALLIFPRLGGHWHAAEKRWKWPCGASFEFGYCETYVDATRYQGQEYTRINFDELGQIADERIVDFLCTRLRTTDPTYPIRPMFAASANPGGAGHAMLRRRYIDPTQKGTCVYTTPEGITRAFIPGLINENPSIQAAYIQRLKSLPEVQRRQLLEGDWEAGAGAALDELDENVHFVAPFQIPPHWPRYAAFDWGFRHPWWFIAATVDPDGNWYVYQCTWGRGQLPHDIAHQINEVFSGERFTHIAAGHDVMHVRKAMDENTPTIAETFLQHDLILDRANIHRVLGLNHCRKMLAWRTTENGRPGVPVMRFFRTPSVMRLFSELKNIVVNPDRPEDALKVDANPDTGEGGDDAYDCFRYLCASRVSVAHSEAGGDSLQSTFDPEVLRVEYEMHQKNRHLLLQFRDRMPSWAAQGGTWEIT